MFFQKDPTIVTGSDTHGESKWQSRQNLDLWHLPRFAHPASSRSDLPRKSKQMEAAYAVIAQVYNSKQEATPQPSATQKKP